MERNSLFLFLFMMFVWAGLCSAQTTGDKFVLIDGCFFITKFSEALKCCVQDRVDR